jgi:steroid delta-isomerase-like uncharacterized protein
MVSETSIRNIIEAYTEHWAARDVAAIAACYASDVVVSDPTYAEPLRGREAVKKDTGDFFVAFPDLQLEVRTVLVEGATFALEGTMAGTHTGPMQLPSGLIPATNRRVEFPFAVMGAIGKGGEITEERRYYDVAGQLVQLGLMQ